MNKRVLVLLSLVLVLLLSAGCGAEEIPETPPPAAEPETSESPGASKDAVADASQMVTPEDVVDPGLVPVCADALRDGTYDIAVDSSSSMFSITACELTVAEGRMTAVMHMGGTGYLYVFPGTGEAAAQTVENGWIPFTEEAEPTPSLSRWRPLTCGWTAPPSARRRSCGMTAPWSSGRTPCPRRPSGTAPLPRRSP